MSAEHQVSELNISDGILNSILLVWLLPKQNTTPLKSCLAGLECGQATDPQYPESVGLSCSVAVVAGQRKIVRPTDLVPLTSYKNYA